MREIFWLCAGSIALQESPQKYRKRKRAAEPAVEEQDRVQEVIHAILRFNEALEDE